LTAKAFGLQEHAAESPKCFHSFLD